MSIALRPASAKRSSTANDVALSAVQPNTLPPKTIGGIMRSVSAEATKLHPGCFLFGEDSPKRGRAESATADRRRSFCNDTAKIECERRLHVADDAIEQARRWFAEELRLVARVRDDALVQAFATARRAPTTVLRTSPLPHSAFAPMGEE